MGDMAVVAGVGSYMVAITFLLPLAGFGGVAWIKPGEGAIDFGSNTTTVETPKQGLFSAFVECVVTGGLVFSFFLPFTDCSRSTTSTFFEPFNEAIEALFSLIKFAFSVLKFFFQLLILNVAGLEPWFILLFFHLPGAYLAVVGIRLVRGVG